MFPSIKIRKIMFNMLVFVLASMRVLNSLIDPRVGGPQTRALTVARKLKNQGIETEFLLPDGDDEFALQARNAGFKVHRPGLTRMKPPSRVLNNVLYSIKFPQAIRRIRRLIINRSIDVVHANMSMNIDTAIATWLSPAPLIWHFNDAHAPWPIAYTTSSLAAQISDEIVVASNGVSEHYFKNSSRSTNVIYAPVDTYEFDPTKVSKAQIHQELGISKNTKIVGTVGSIKPIKGQEYLIRAAKKIRDDSDIDITVLIIGDKVETQSKTYDRLQVLCNEFSLNDIVYFLGYRSDIPELLSSLDVFVLPSLAEACSVAILEAMAMKNPIIATDVGGIPEQINDGESGWLVPPEDSIALAKKVQYAIENEIEAQRREDNARQRVLNTFSLKHCVERHVNIYEKAAADK